MTRHASTAVREALFRDVAAEADRAARRNPGAPADQPVHTRYVAADVFTPDTIADDGAEAVRLLGAHAGDVDAFARAFDLPADLAGRVRPRTLARLARQPVEDLRVDFEDGYGRQDDAREDADADAAGAALAGVVRSGAGDAPRPPRRVGLRVKGFADGDERRSVRTLERFLTALFAAGPSLPAQVVVTFPKVVAAGHVRAFAQVLSWIEHDLRLVPGSLRFEIQVETTSSLLGPPGNVPLRHFAELAAGRLQAVHLGVFDLTAALDLPPGEQRIDHPSCDTARDLVRFALAGTGVELADGSTNVRPADDSTRAVHRAWAAHAAGVRHSLRSGWWQGWDVHPSHLVSRFAAVHAHHLATLDEHTARVRAHREGRPGPGGVIDEPATVAVLLRALVRAVRSGAVEAREVEEAAGGRIGVDTAPSGPGGVSQPPG